MRIGLLLSESGIFVLLLDVMVLGRSFYGLPLEQGEMGVMQLAGLLAKCGLSSHARHGSRSEVQR